MTENRIECILLAFMCMMCPVLAGYLTWCLTSEPGGGILIGLLSFIASIVCYFTGMDEIECMDKCSKTTLVQRTYETFGRSALWALGISAMFYVPFLLIIVFKAVPLLLIVLIAAAVLAILMGCSASKRDRHDLS